MGPDTGLPAPWMPAPCNRHNAHAPHDRCPGTAPEFPWEPVETVPDTASDRPSPRRGGPRSLRAVDLARELIDESAPGMLNNPVDMALWIGQARAVLRELTRDA